MFQYATPANIDDLVGRPAHDAFLKAWHESIKQHFADEITGLPPGNRLFFTETASPATSADLPITWNAFPLSILRDHPDVAIDRWGAADKIELLDRSPQGAAPAPMPYRVQDEYCEWFAYRQTPGGPITRIVFTAEAPEYWIMLAEYDFDWVVQLYQKHVSPLVQADDLKLKQDISFSSDLLLKKGHYNPYNKWNTTQGVMHLTHPANTLGAEINLAARATIPRKNAAGARITEVRRFACCSDFGDANRSSDPNIGNGVNLTVIPAGAAATAQSITLANPVALYIDRLASGAITDENGNPLSGWFKIVRGVTGRGLMAVLEPPAGATFGLDKIRVGNKKLTHGGQVSERIQMVLYGKTANLGKPIPPLQACVNHCCRPNTLVEVSKVNLNQTAANRACVTPTPKDAFPELVAPAHGGFGMAAAEETLAPIPKLGKSRLGSGYAK